MFFTYTLSGFLFILNITNQKLKEIILTRRTYEKNSYWCDHDGFSDQHYTF
jgi:hypothetical protein